MSSTVAGRYIRDYYRVPAEQGVRVIVDGDPGVITGFIDHYLQVLFDYTPEPLPVHPVWRVEYLTDQVSA